MENLNFSKLSKEELKETKGGSEPPKTCDCGWFNGMMKDYYDSTCGCSGMGNVFGFML
jgi:hypothetical protein